jgi:L-seryl-tRNA(Ser) seleniumtransferase
MDTGTNILLRSIPSMEEMLSAPWAACYISFLGREQVKAVIGAALDEVRREILDAAPVGLSAAECAVERAKALLYRRSSNTLKPLINATGIVIHTNLGRAPLAKEALDAVNSIAASFSTLEYSPEKGVREGRNIHVEEAICGICGAEAALVVNNNAAAVLLALSALASGREVIVSAGELVEIGGSFRIPEILAFSGAKMVSVGCTNSTRISDYRNAITENTAVLLKVHPSNYHIEGFVKSASREELAELAASRSLVFMEDLGSGLLSPLDTPLADREQPVRSCLDAGARVVTFSGDKLLGGPQIGVVAGSKKYIDAMKKHQLLRALRVDKMTLAAFGATLRMYRAGRQKEIPVINMIESSGEVLRQRAWKLCRLLKNTAGGSSDYAISVVETRDAIGGGAFPADTLPGFGVALRSALQNAETLAALFRAAPVPVIPVIRDGRVILHVRTLLAGEEKTIAQAFTKIIGGERS